MTEQQTLPPSSAPIFDTASWDALTSDGASADEVRIMVAVLTGRPLQTLRSEAYVGTPALPHQMLGQLFDTLGTPNNIAILGEVVAAGGTKNAFFAHMLDEEFADFDASGFRTRFVKKSHPSVASRIVSEEVERARQAEAAAAAAEVERVRHAAEAAAAAAAEAEQRVRQAEAAAAAEEAERARLAEEADAAEKLRASTAAAGGVADTKSPEGDGHDEKSTEISSSHDDFGDFMTKQTGNESVGGKHDKLLAAEAAKLLQAEKERAAKKEADDDDVMQDTSDGIWMTKTVAGGTAPAAAAAAAPPVPPTSGLDVVEEATSPTRSSGAATKVEDGVSPPPDGEAGYPMTMDSYVDEDGEIGRGAFAKVILCKVKGREIVQDDGTMGLERVAIKKIEADTQDMDLIQKEVDMMKLCRNRNMLKTHKNFLDGTTLYIVMPVMDYGSMHDVVKELEARGTYAHGGESLKEEWVSIVIYKAICGLMYLHDKGYVHRDIKAANILLGADGEIKLCDYGVASMVYSEGCQTDTCETFVGTPCWMAPELMRQNIPYAQKADMWSIGITALELAKGYAPYERERPMKIILMTLSQAAPTLDTYENYPRKGPAGTKQPKPAAKFSATFRNLLGCLLVTDPAKRYSARQALDHKCLKRYFNDEVRCIKARHGAPAWDSLRRGKLAAKAPPMKVYNDLNSFFPGADLSNPLKSPLNKILKDELIHDPALDGTKLSKCEERAAAAKGEPVEDDFAASHEAIRKAVSSPDAGAAARET